MCGVAQDAASGNGQLLQATQAFALSARIASPGVLRLHWNIAPHYYLYRGRIQVQSKDAAMHLGELSLPDGLKEHDPYLGNVEIYHGSLDARVPYSGTAANLPIAVTFQGCHEVDPKICYPPVTQVLSVPLAGSQAGAIVLPDSDSVQRGGTRGFQPQMAAESSLSSSGPESTHSTVAPPLHSALSDLPLALVLAFVGGLILNLMPCVLPVLAIKAIGLLESAESPARTRTHALAYTAGVLASFLTLGLCILAMRSAGHALGWGTQLQQPLVVAVLACVLFVLGLNLSGIVRLGLGIGSTGSALMMRPGLAGDFFTGVLAVVIASPCTAPFMGTALAYAFVAPGVAALPVFLMLGLGLALPFLLIGFIPRFARWLPRPGRWMETLKQLLAFPMYLSAVWLVWVVANQRGVDAAGLALISMVLIAMALWWFERNRPGHGSAMLRGLAIIPLLLAIAPIALIARLPAAGAPAHSQTAALPYDPARLAQLRARHVPVFVNMSADWCVTCKANEYAVLDTNAFRELLRRTGTVYMQGDWTHEDPAISAFLKEYDSPGVPVYVLFPRDGSPGRKLPTVLTAGFLQRSLTAAAQ
ncbi:MAG TPA: protein-disulfide reductase DsbD [Rhodanobacteraceae bacterium]|nr:protein-disulfide reductase DsbD [Rhodanobacteraceae bacterium]